MSGHAPRGRIKARDHMDSVDQMERPRCVATAKGSRQRCKRPPIPGGTVCKKHGGGAPQVQAAAARRLADLIPKAVEYYDWLLSQKDYPSAGLGAANAVWDREKGKPQESVALNITQSVAALSDDELKAKALALIGMARADR